MLFLKKLFGPADPTRSWPKVPMTTTPVLDLSRPAFGSLIFGDRLESAEFLGRPNKAVIHPRTVDLTYPGFQLEFEDGEFVFVNIYLKPYPDRTSTTELRLTDGTVITPASTSDEMIARFGDSYDDEQWEHHGVLQYYFGKMVFEAVFDDDRTTLEQVNAYLN